MKYQLEDYQKTAVDHIIHHPKCALFLDPGAGKTLCTLHALNELKVEGHILVIAPLKIARSTWFEEIDKWGFNIRTKSFIYDENDKAIPADIRQQLYANVLTDKPTMYFINRDKVIELVNFYENAAQTIGLPMLWPFETIVIDESQSFKSPEAERSIALAKTMPYTKRLIELSGTPAPNGLLDIWNQIYLCDNGAAFGNDFNQFRSTYFHKVDPQNPYSAWEITKNELFDMEAEIHRRMRNTAISVKNADLKLPDVIINDVMVHLSNAEKKKYNRLSREAIIERDLDPDNSDDLQRFIVADSDPAKRSKLNQFAQGSLYINDDKDIDYVHRHKLDIVENIMENTADNALLFYYYQSDRKRLLEDKALSKYKPVIFDGSRAMTQAWNAGKIRLMMLHPGSAGHGHNLQDGGHTAIWFTLPNYNGEQYQQANARLARKGQKNTVIIHRLITKGTVDALQPRALEKKAITESDLKEALLP